MAERLIGRVTHYFGKARVAAIEITEGQLNVGDSIHIHGSTSDFIQKVTSMQVEHAAVQTAKKGDHIGLQTDEQARENDQVYLVVPE